MIEICDIESYIPSKKISNYEKKNDFKLSDNFIESKLGVKSVSRIEKSQFASDLCCIAFERLIARKINLDTDDLDILIVCTQNPDYSLPHTSAIVHGKLDFPSKCAAFDISIGCSGYVYSLAVIESLMNLNDMSNGLLFTADPYSKIIDEKDKSTSLLFGDAATVTYISRKPVFHSSKFTFGTQGKNFDYLICKNKKLSMKGREIFNFVARVVPEDVKKVLEINGLEINDIDRFLFHQGSKYIIDFLIKRIGLPKGKTPYAIENYGNTVSSSIPIMLKDYLTDTSVNRILISGFGVGLSWASGILNKTKK